MEKLVISAESKELASHARDGKTVIIYSKNKSIQ